MRIALLTPGTGTFYCGSCLRDSSLAVALRKLGHDAEMVPLYLPFVLEGHGAEERAPVHLGGINMYLQQKLPALGRAPGALTRLLDAPGLLRWASGRGDMVDAHSLGALTLSTLRGESGRQKAEIAKLVEFLAERPPFDVVCLSNVMLAGIVRSLKTALGTPVVCTLQGEEPFLDALPSPWREDAWAELSERAQDVDRFVPVSAHYGERMRERLELEPERVRVVHNGIELDGFAVDAADADGPASPPVPPVPPVLGYLARMCPEKGLATLVDAFVELKRRDTVPGLRLAVAGTRVRADEPFVDAQRAKLEAAGCAGDAEFRPNLEREEKLRFLRSLSALSVPATYGESFGLYLLEALAAGVPVVQPRHGAFPEVLAATGGGVLVEPDDAMALADGLEALLRDPERARALGAAGRAAVHERFGVERMAREFAAVCAGTEPEQNPSVE